MSRQIQIRRGSATDHANFTGAIGEITMDTTNKTLRVHDGTTAGGTILAKKSEIPIIPNFPDTMDYVIETQLPTSQNNYTWYRKYKSGWVEQGGFIPANTGTTAIVTTLPVEMADGNYTVLGSVMESYTGTSSGGFNFYDRTTTSFKINKNNSNRNLMWRVAGQSAITI